MNPIFSIIVPTYKRPDTLSECLKHLSEAAKHFNNNEIEVIVTDDDDILETEKYLSRHKFNFHLSIVEGPHRGPAANRNNGAKLAQSDWLLFTDDDCLPDTDFIDSYRKAIVSYPDILVFEGKTIADREQRTFNEQAPINITGNLFWSCNICIHRNAFFSVSGFDEMFPYPYMEDIDLGTRLIRSFTVKFVDEAIVIHPWRPKRGWNGYRQNIDSAIYFYQKHYLSLKPSRFLYFKYFIASIPKRFALLTKMKFKGTKNFFQENYFALRLAVRFFFNIKK